METKEKIINKLHKTIERWEAFMTRFTEDKYADYREIKTREEAEIFEKEKYGAYCEEYNRINKVMIRYKYRINEMGYFMDGYLGNAYVQINKYLRSDEKNDVRLNAIIDRVNEFIFCAPQLDENMVLYRSVSEETMEIIQNHVKEHNGQYTEKGFMSTSLRLDTILKEFPTRNCILKIYVPKGAFVLGVDPIKNRHEEEMLFPESQWLKYISKKKNRQINKMIYEFELINN